MVSRMKITLESLLLAGILLYPQKGIADEERNYQEFPFKNEVPRIMSHANRLGVEPELLMAIRCAENGSSKAYGIMPRGELLKAYKKDKGYYADGEFRHYADENEKQLAWAAWTVKQNISRFEQNPSGHTHFLSFLSSRYAPLKAKNDPKNLNYNWMKNVSHHYYRLKNESN